MTEVCETASFLPGDRVEYFDSDRVWRRGTIIPSIDPPDGLSRVPGTKWIRWDHDGSVGSKIPGVLRKISLLELIAEAAQ